MCMLNKIKLFCGIFKKKCLKIGMLEEITRHLIKMMIFYLRCEVNLKLKIGYNWI